MPVTKTGNIDAFFNQTAGDFIRLASEAAKDKLADNVTAGGRGGVQYSGLPRRSSTPNEFPQEQFGDLKASADVQNAGNLFAYHVGFFDDDEAKLRFLEFGRGEIGPVQRTMESPDTHKVMTQKGLQARR